MDPIYQKTYPQAIDEIASQDPNRTFAEYLDPPYLSNEAVHVLTYKDLANSINRLAWWLQDQFQTLGVQQGDTVCFIGYSDLRYHLIFVAMMKCRVKVLFSAPPNQIAAHQKLVDETKSKVLIYTQEDPISDLRKAIQLPSIALPSVLDLINAETVPHFPYNVKWEDIAKETVIYFHTSGTTGFPKARASTYSHLAQGPRKADSVFQGRKLSDYELGSLNRSKPRRSLIGTVLYHPGMLLVFTGSVCRGSVCVLPPPHIPMAECTAEKMTEWFQRSNCDSALIFPSKLNPALNNDEYLAKLQKLDFVSYGGAALNPALAQKLLPATQLFCVWGSTETGSMQLFQTDKEDWQYFCLDPALEGVEFRERDTGKHELVFVRNDELINPPQAVFTALQDIDEHCTGDLFEPHPTKANHWKFASRDDDNIILSVGQNINPAVFERRVKENCPLLKSATMFGDEKPRPCVVVDLFSPDDLEQQLDAIWTAVQAATQDMTDYERIERNRIIITDPKRPVPINDKGAVMRRKLGALYKDDIDGCYT